MFITVLVASALAQEPQVQVTPHGSVRGQLIVPASLDEVRAALGDSAARAIAVDNGATVSATPDGDCEVEQTYAPHPIKSVTYTLRTCPTDLGFHSTLVESNDLTRFEVTWEIRPAHGGTEVIYDLDLEPSFPLPGFIVRASTKKGVLEALSGIARHFDR